MRILLLAAAIAATAACAARAPVATAPPAVTRIDPAAIDLYIATCRWTWFDELGDAIDEPALLACVKAAARGQTVEAFRAELRARPDFRQRSHRNHYGQPSISRRAFSQRDPS